MGFRRKMTEKFTPSVAYRSGKLRFRPVVSIFDRTFCFGFFFRDFFRSHHGGSRFFWHFLRLFWPGPIFCYFTGPFSPMFASVDFFGFGVLHLPEFLVGFFGVFGGFEDSLVFLRCLRFFWIFFPFPLW